VDAADLAAVAEAVVQALNASASSPTVPTPARRGTAGLDPLLALAGVRRYADFARDAQLFTLRRTPAGIEIKPWRRDGPGYSPDKQAVQLTSPDEGDLTATLERMLVQSAASDDSTGNA
jgi:hypothetical protein